MKIKNLLVSLFLIPHLSLAVDSLDYCKDLMNKVRDTYGKAPLCVPVVGKGGNDLTSISGLVGLSDDMTPSHAYFHMMIQGGQLNNEYSYDEHELRQLISLMKIKGKGVTKNQGEIIYLDSAIQNLDNSLKKGLIDKEYHDDAVSTLEKAKKQFQNN